MQFSAMIILNIQMYNSYENCYTHFGRGKYKHKIIFSYNQLEYDGLCGFRKYNN